MMICASVRRPCLTLISFVVSSCSLFESWSSSKEISTVLLSFKVSGMDSTSLQWPVLPIFFACVWHAVDDFLLSFYQGVEVIIEQAQPSWTVE